LFKIKFIKIH